MKLLAAILCALPLVAHGQAAFMQSFYDYYVLWRATPASLPPRMSCALAVHALTKVNDSTTRALLTSP